MKYHSLLTKLKKIWYIFEVHDMNQNDYLTNNASGYISETDFCNIKLMLGFKNDSIINKLWNQSK